MTNIPYFILAMSRAGIKLQEADGKLAYQLLDEIL
jgi:hypothetical protein